MLLNFFGRYFYLILYFGGFSVDDYAILLAEIGGGKKRLLDIFIVRGIQQLLNHLRLSRILSKKELSQEEQIALSNCCEILI